MKLNFEKNGSYTYPTCTLMAHRLTAVTGTWKHELRLIKAVGFKFWVYDLRFRVGGLRFRVRVLGFRA